MPHGHARLRNPSETAPSSTAKMEYGHGQQSVPPVNIPIPTKIGSKMGGEFTYPKMLPLVLTTTALCFLWVHGVRGTQPDPAFQGARPPDLSSAPASVRTGSATALARPTGEQNRRPQTYTSNRLSKELSQRYAVTRVTNYRSKGGKT